MCCGLVEFSSGCSWKGFVVLGRILVASGSGRGGFSTRLLLLVAWLLVVSSVAAVAQEVGDEPPGPGVDEQAVPVVEVDGGPVDPEADSPAGLNRDRLVLPGELRVDDPLDPVLPPPVVSPIVVDDPLPELPVWEGNPEEDRPGLTIGVSEVVVDPGAKRAAPVGSALSFEVAARDEFPESVRFEVETFKPELVESVSPFRAGFRVDASVDSGVLVWDSPVDVVLDYEDLPVLHGAGAASRLEFQLLEGCQLVAGTEKGSETIECKSRTRLDSVSDASGRVVRASLSPEVLGRVLDLPSRVEAFDLSGGGFTMLAMGSSSSGPGGDFTAAPHQTVSAWDVGLFTGAAETSYPIELPEAAVGPTPSVMLSYSSAAIDRMHEFSNNQVGSIGAGWSYTPGYITRHLKPCTSSGHLCTAGDEYSIVLNGVSSRLVQDSGASFRVQDDPNWRVSRLTAPAGHPDANDKYWEVTAKDGTKYIFGLTDDSAQTIPLNGGADHVYQWDLSEIVDTDGNSAYFHYGQEINHYGSGLDYVQSSHLREIEYSFLGSQPSLRVRFNHEVRCGDASTTFGDCTWPNDFVDTPTDLWCPSGSGCSESSPTFWSGLRLGSIQVQTLRNTDGGRWSTLALYDLAQNAPTPTGSTNEGDPDDSEPRTLLYRVHRRPEGEYTYNAYQQIEAEDHTYDSGVSVVASNDVGGGDAVKWSSSSHISFHETHFEQGAIDVIVRVASDHTGQQIKVRDSYTGSDLATITIPDTGGLEDYVTVSATVSGLSGTEDLYLIFTGSNEARINWVRFKPATTQDSLQPVDYGSNWQWLGNRKNHDTNGDGSSDGLAPMVVARIGTIVNEYGGKVTFSYLDDGDDCIEWGDPGFTHWKDNTEHCFPVNAGGGVWITFLKWVVDDVTVEDPVQNTTGVYEYTYGTPRWAKNISPTADLCDTSWDVPRGHSWVQVEDPFGLKTKTWFYQGIDGDLANCNGTERTDPPDELDIYVFGETWRDDEYWLVGRPAGSVTYDTLGSEFLRTETFYTWSTTAGSGARDAARFIGTDRVITTTKDGGVSKDTRVSYEYDSYGNVTETFYHGDLADLTDNRYVETTYLANASVWIVDRPKETKLYDSTPSGDTEIGRTRYLWDNQAYGVAPTEGHLTEEQGFWSSNTADHADTEYTYKTDGRLATVTNPNNHTTTYGYDDVGVPYGRLVTVTDAEGHITTTGYDSYFRVDAVTDTRGKVTDAFRDEYGRITAVDAPSSSTNAVRYTYTDYATSSNPARLWTETYVDGTYIDTYTFMDGFGNAFQTQAVSPNSGQRVVTTGFNNDDLLPKYQSEPFETSGTAGSGAVTPTWTTLPLWHRYQYNPQAEQTHDETLITNTVQWDVVTNQVGWWKTTFTDENNIDQIHFYDAFSNTTRIDELIDSAWVATSYEFDKADRLEKVTDAASNVTTVVYDWLGRKTSMTDPDMGTWSYEYDPVGNLIEQTDGRNQILSFEYDAINRMIGRYDGPEGNRTLLAEWDYYTNSSDTYEGLLDYSKAHYSGFGAIEQHYDAYDNSGRLTDQRTIVPDTGTFRTQWSYDLNGNLTALTYPSGGGGAAGETVTYDYNTRGLVDGIDGDDIYVDAATYEYWGAPDTMTLGTGSLAVARNFDYLNNRRLAFAEAGVGAASNNISALYMTGYHPNGNVVKLTDWTSGSPNVGQRQCFEYDEANRMTRAFTTTDINCGWVDTTKGVGGYDHTFTYDTIGNLKTRTDTGTYTYGQNGAGPHAVTTIGSSYSFDYDGNGNITDRDISGTQQDLEWSADNRLESVTEGSDVTEFFYDADGNRIVRVTPDATTVYVNGIYEHEVDDSTSVNIAPNPGFETTSGWTENASTVLGEATSHHRSTWGIADNHTGSYGRTIANVVYGYLESNSITVTPGHQYDAYLMARGQIDPDDSRGPNDPAWLVRVQFYDGSGQSLSYVDADSGTPSEISTTWAVKGGRVTAPSGAVTMGLRLYFYNAQGWMAFDDASVVDVANPTVQLLTNPGFETSGGWSEHPSGPLGEATSFWRGTWGIGEERSGSYAYAITNIAYGNARSGTVNVTGGSQYDVYGWVRGLVDAESSLGNNWIIRVLWFDSQDNYLSYTNAKNGPGSDLTTTWQQKGGRVTAPQNAAKAAIDLYMYNATGWVAYDDISVVPATGGANLLADPGFENGNDWTSYVSGPLGEATSHWRGSWGIGEERSGSYAHVITNTTYGWLTSDEIGVTGGANYDLHAWIRGRLDPDDSRDGTVWVLRVSWYDDTGGYLGYNNTAGGGPASIPTSWTQVGGTTTAPQNAATATIDIYQYMGSGWINFDDITLKTTASETQYYPFNGDTIALRQDGELYWMITDHLSSTATTYKADGTELTHQYYYPWGNLRGSSAPVVPTDIGYTGQRLDTSTDLMHYKARYYDPTIGRFISADTIVPDPLNPQHLNRYSYVTNNPLTYNDPTGHDPDESYLCPGSMYECTSDAKTHSAQLWEEWHELQIWLRQQSAEAGPTALDISRLLYELGDAGLGFTGTAGTLVDERFGDYVLRPSGIGSTFEVFPEGQYRWKPWKIDISSVPKALQSDYAARVTKHLSRLAAKGSFILAFVVDAREIVGGASEAGVIGFVYEVTETGFSWGATAAGMGLGAKVACKGNPYLCAGGILVGGLTANLAANPTWELVPSPYQDQ